MFASDEEALSYIPKNHPLYEQAKAKIEQNKLLRQQNPQQGAPGLGNALGMGQGPDIRSLIGAAEKWPVENITQGLGYSAQNTANNVMQNLGKFLSPVAPGLQQQIGEGLHIIPEGEGFGFGLGKLAGDIATPMAPQFKALQGAQLAKRAGRVLTSGGIGAATSENPLLGALGGAGAGILGEALPAIARGAANVPQKLRDLMEALGAKVTEHPDVLAKRALTEIGGGRDVQQAATEFNNLVRSTHKFNKDEVQRDYDAILKTAQKLKPKIYEIPRKQEESKLILPESVKAQAEKPPVRLYNPGSETLDVYRSKTLKNAHDKYMRNPTVENAQDLNNKLGARIEDYATPKNVIEKDEKKLLEEAKNKIKTEIKNHLSKVDPKLAEEYKKIDEKWANTVKPFTNTQDKRKILAGENPTNISDIFKERKPSNRKVVEQVGPHGKRLLTYESLAGQTGEPTAKELLANIGKQPRKGTSYISPNEMKALQKQLRESQELHAKTSKQVERADKIKDRTLYSILGSLGVGAGGELLHKLGLF